MNAEEWKAYAKELGDKAGLDKEQAAAWLQVFDNEKIREGLVSRSDYSRDLDSVRDKSAKDTKDKVTQDIRAYYQKWADTEVQPKLDQALKVVDELSKYKAAYGDLTSSGNGDNPPVPKGLSKEDVEKMLADQLSAIQGSVISRQKAAMRVASRHLHDFNEVLEPDELEKFAQEHGYTDIDKAYSAFVQPRHEAALAEKHKEEVAKAREEGIKEGRSRAAAPTAHEREYTNPFFRAKDEKGEDPRAAFFAGLEEGQ